jgi:hypothetical protein
MPPEDGGRVTLRTASSEISFGEWNALTSPLRKIRSTSPYKRKKGKGEKEDIGGDR